MYKDTNRPFEHAFNQNNRQDWKTNNKNIKNENRGKSLTKINDKDIENIINAIKRNGPLSKTLSPEEINLPNKIGYTIGKKFANSGSNTNRDDKCLNTNQLRKYFQLISNVSSLENFEEQKKELFKVLPQIAYAAGRNVCPKNFYFLMEACISQEALKSKDDINTLIDFLTAIVAYSKLNSK